MGIVPKMSRSERAHIGMRKSVHFSASGYSEALIFGALMRENCGTRGCSRFHNEIRVSEELESHPFPSSFSAAPEQILRYSNDNIYFFMSRDVVEFECGINSLEFF